VHWFVVDAAPQTRSGSKQLTVKNNSANHRRQRAPRVHIACIQRQRRGAAAAERWPSARLMKRRICTLSVITAVAAAACGCSSITARSYSGGDPKIPRAYPGVYPGVRHTTYCLEHVDEIPEGHLLRPIFIADLPFSAALDTVLLPFDWPYSACCQHAPEEEEPK